MPEFVTPEPISVSLELGAGNVTIAASDRADTAVDVRPSDERNDSDVQAAAQVRVDFANGALRIVGPKARTFDFSRKTRSVEVRIEMPTGSTVSTETQVGDVRCTGRLGESRLTTSAGNFSLDQTGSLRVATSAGHLSVEHVSGDAELSTSSGRVELATVEGAVTIKNSNGATTIGSVAGDARIRSANGDISIDRAGAGVDAKTSNGGIRLGEVVQGAVVLETAMGDLEVGIAEGTAAWVEAKTSFGRVRNLLDAATAPDAADLTAEIRAHTSYGDITVRRSGATTVRSDDD